MSYSTENTNELDSYGVWVKNTNEENGKDDLNFADSLDLPDFEESDSIEDADFSDMFKEDDSINLDSMSDDTTLTDDELMNITSGDGIQLEEASAENITADDLDFNTEISDDSDIDQNSLDDISFDSLEENSVSEADLSSFEDVSIEEPATESTEPTENDFTFEEVNTGDTTFEEVAAQEPLVEEASEPAAEESIEEMNLDDFAVEENTEAEEEISLDDFMDSGFSDDTVASGNNGFAADSAPASSASEEVSLDDFVDMSDFGVEEEAPKKEEQITDEKPLDMDISFDSSADTITTEENIDSDMLDDDLPEEEETAQPESETEAVDLSSFGNDIESEEVALSDFGIDADAEETPVTQDVEAQKNKEAVVDYDLSVGDGNMNTAPVVNEIKSTVEEITEAEEIPEALDSPEPAATTVDNSLLQQIVADLSNLKNEINTLKNNLEEMKASPAPAAEAQGIISEEIAIEEPVIEEDSKEDTGFFSGDDGDDTIALSTDELSNILNTADFSENAEEATVEDDSTSFEAADEAAEAFTEESEEPVAAEEPTATEEPAIEEEPDVIEEPAIEEESFVEEAFVEEAPAEPTIEDKLEDEAIGEEVSEETLGAISDTSEDINFDFGEDNLSEPNLDDIELDEEVLEDDLPDEIEISKDDDILVESSSSDFMDSVQDTTDEHAEEEKIEEEQEEAPLAQEPVIEDSFVEESLEETAEDSFADDFTEESPQTKETVPEEAPEDFTIEDENFSTVDNLFDQPEISEVDNFVSEPSDEITEETFVEEEAVTEDAVTEEPATEDAQAEEAIIEESPAEPEIQIQEETIADESVEEETVIEESVIEEEPVIEEPVIEDETFVEEPIINTAPIADIDNDFVSHEDDNNELTDSNIDYLTTEEKEPEESVDENAELKKDIKSVLLYMDQLLENLPEEKIVEFAKSDEFTTYKKLFSELGLS